jgi:hypothetical protein
MGYIGTVVSGLTTSLAVNPSFAYPGGARSNEGSLALLISRSSRLRSVSGLSAEAAGYVGSIGFLSSKALFSWPKEYEEWASNKPYASCGRGSFEYDETDAFFLQMACCNNTADSSSDDRNHSRLDSRHLLLKEYNSEGRIASRSLVTQGLFEYEITNNFVRRSFDGIILDMALDSTSKTHSRRALLDLTSERVDRGSRT